MKKILIVLFFILCLLILIINISASVPIEWYNQSTDANFNLNGNNQYFGQTFTIGNSSANNIYHLDYVLIGLQITSDNCIVQTALRYFPFGGNDLTTSNLINTEYLMTPYFYGILNVSMNYTLSPSGTYALIVRGFNCSNGLSMISKFNGNYPGGSLYETFDNGLTFTNNLGGLIESNFQIWGTAISPFSNLSVNLNLPTNNSIVHNNNQFFISNFFDFTNLTNSTFYIYNGTSILSSSTKYISGYSNSSYNYFSLPYYGTFNWNYKSCDITNNCSFGNNFTLNYVNPLVNCVPLTCQQIANMKYDKSQNCGTYSDSCGGTLNCGNCPDSNYPNNYMSIIGCNPDCFDGTGQDGIKYQSCDNLTKNGIYYWNPILQNSYNEVLNFMGGINYLKQENYPIPNVNVTLDCSVGNQFTVPTYSNVAYWDNYGQPHEFLHWMMRHYANPTTDFYSAVEEGFTNTISYYLNNLNDPCFDADKGTCTVSDDQLCTPGLCNYQGVQAGMIRETDNDLHCDIAHCWKWFFDNIIANKSGDSLGMDDIYSFLVSYTKNKTAVDTVLNRYLPSEGINLNNYVPYNYNIPNSAYPNSEQPSNNPPTTTLNSPSDQLYTNLTNITFSCSAKDDIQLKNISLYTNITGNFILNQSKNIIGISNSTEFNITNILNGTYLWSCFTCNNNSICEFGNNQTFKINTSYSYVNNDPVYPTFSNYYDNNATLIGSGIGLFNITVNNTNGTVYLNINNQKIKANRTTVIGSNSFIENPNINYFLNQSNEAGSYRMGEKIKPNINMTLVYVTKTSFTNTNTCYLYQGSNLLATSSFIGDDATFNYNLTAGIEYSIFVDKGGSNYDISIGSPSYPVIGTYLNWTGDFGLGYAEAIKSIAINLNTSTTTNNFSISYYMNDSGNYIYNWSAYGNGTNNNLNTSNSINYIVNATNDNIYPIFYNNVDNNATLINSGIGYFNISINNTNGTVFLNINGNSIKTLNISNKYLANYTFSNYGNYIYNWSAYGNGTNNNLNTSNNYNYLVNQSQLPESSNGLIEWNNDTSNVNSIQAEDEIGQIFKIGTRTLNKDYNLTNISLYLKTNNLHIGNMWIELINYSNSQILTVSSNYSTSYLGTDFSWFNFNINYTLNANGIYLIKYVDDLYYETVSSGFTTNLYPQGSLYYAGNYYDDYDLLFNIYAKNNSNIITPICNPDCSCSLNTCGGQSCSDGCGGSCQGNKDCGGISNPTYTYPTFSNYYDNSPVYLNSSGLFRVLINNTNGTVFLNINGKNLTTTYSQPNIYSVLYNLSNINNYNYYWFSYANDSYKSYANSLTNEFIIQDYPMIQISNQKWFWSSNSLNIFNITSNNSLYLLNYGSKNSVYIYNLTNPKINGTITNPSILTNTYMNITLDSNQDLTIK